MRQTPEPLIHRAAETFSARYGRRPTAYGVGPGRVEILGNHTDYNGGCVLTAAIDRHVVAVGRALDDRLVQVHALDAGASATFRLDELHPVKDAAWLHYVQSVFAVLGPAGVPLGGMQLVICGDIPLGAGLSSSAALEAAVALLALELYPHDMDKLDLARWLQRGENEFVGVRCGLLDPFSSLHGQADRLLFLDCSTCAFEPLSLGAPAPAIVICNSGVTRTLGRDAPYNVRRAECEQATARLARSLGRPLRALCEVSSAELLRVAAEVPEPLLSRARHVIGEHERVLAAREYLRAGDLQRLGPLLFDSHESSRTLFENSHPALDELCAAAARQPGCLGARLTGAGWGGCTVNLVTPESVETFVKALPGALPRATPQRTTHQDDLPPRADLLICHASTGAWGQSWVPRF